MPASARAGSVVRFRICCAKSSGWPMRTSRPKLTWDCRSRKARFTLSVAAAILPMAPCTFRRPSRIESLLDALRASVARFMAFEKPFARDAFERSRERRSEEHTSELQSQSNLVCRLLLEKKKKKKHK